MLRAGVLHGYLLEVWLHGPSWCPPSSVSEASTSELEDGFTRNDMIMLHQKPAIRAPLALEPPLTADVRYCLKNALTSDLLGNPRPRKKIFGSYIWKDRSSCAIE